MSEIRSAMSDTKVSQDRWNEIFGEKKEDDNIKLVKSNKTKKVYTSKIDGKTGQSK